MNEEVRLPNPRTCGHVDTGSVPLRQISVSTWACVRGGWSRSGVRSGLFIRLSLKNTRAPLEVARLVKFRETSDCALRDASRALHDAALLRTSNPLAVHRCSASLQAEVFEPGLCPSTLHRAHNARACLPDILSILFFILLDEKIANRDNAPSELSASRFGIPF